MHRNISKKSCSHRTEPKPKLHTMSIIYISYWLCIKVFYVSQQYMNQHYVSEQQSTIKQLK